MSLLVSSLVIPLALLLLIVNIYFRIKVIKRFRSLSNKNISVEPKYFFDRKARATYLKQRAPQHMEELEAFYSLLDKLIRFVLVAFILILLTFIYLYFNLEQ